VIAYCDTSALVKLYIAEAHSRELKRWIENAQAVAACRIAWAEAHAALARRAREVGADNAACEAAKRALADDWPRYLIVEISQPLVELAGEFADTFALRGYDSVQLAAARLLQQQGGQPLGFASFDARLNKAAALLGMGAPDL
jgi:predicted nucleic acid-binding protein